MFAQFSKPNGWGSHKAGTLCMELIIINKIVWFQLFTFQGAHIAFFGQRAYVYIYTHIYTYIYIHLYIYSGVRLYLDKQC